MGYKPSPPPEAVAPAPGAGWFPDPACEHESRYWDGGTWTDNISDQGTAAVDPIRTPDGPAGLELTGLLPMSLLTALLCSGLVDAEIMARPPILAMFPSTRLQPAPFATLIFTGTLLGLRDERDVVLNTYARTAGSESYTNVAVMPWLPRARQGFEGWVMSNLTPGQSSDVLRLIFSWFSGSLYDPFQAVVDTAFDYLVEAQVVARVATDAHRGKLGTLMMGPGTTQVEVAAPAAVAPLADDLVLVARRFMALANREPDLQGHLFADIGKAMRLRVARPSDGLGGGGFSSD